MSSLPERFVIIVDGQHVTKPEHDHDEIRPAEVGEKSSAATFELQGNTLVSGDWALGCSKLAGKVIGNRVPASAVVWLRKDQAQEVYPVTVKDGENGPQLRFSHNSIDEEGGPLALSGKQLLSNVSGTYDEGTAVEIVASQE
ncbi:uncharacterized protein FFB20_04720 [Fusarium fujikuroi]|uniref:Uncharacterized protein n=2 Tax=Fusarium fujikuroi TaxID=5127 RepID=S0DYG1_GIBF5|nr:uncharacterized protein FFUJ_14521 [Fusarium fujikuroi IMI 58289]KLO82745.1 uncharacterized protein LW93_9949 [Fusarium fujikuroi]KLO93383.1 uncharacterized protein LW94_9128 [Fusarium fujikuroi]KLP07101.1 uncharacterized protein Y057_3022 [Fusarium fujikuroi]QGI63574.1 hypothetical protein CEK27_007545 [Fusarium fujikuroi]QGI94455.1 hypothetical protein CEK26_007524 [Fusarium fujikuroi]